MSIIEIVLAIIALFMTGTTVGLFIAMQNARRQVTQFRDGTRTRDAVNASEVEGFIAPLIKDYDPLGNILRFMYNYEEGEATIEEGFDACKLLVSTLDQRCGLKPTGSYRTAVQYDPARYRASSVEGIIKGQEVLLIEPGWTLRGKLLKVPVVAKPWQG